MVALVLGLAVLTQVSDRMLLRAVVGAGQVAETSLQAARETVEPAIFIGGLYVSRSRHVIAGAGLGCTAGAILGAGSAVALGLFTAGAGFATVPTAAAIGCLSGGAIGVALGYPLDSWALEME
ncbi:MAG TPA: hypothetical protein VGU20_02800 [Stellaceae bacterium]|nr:hypothetical protein [Stellaceae bacterium]